ncbi:MAG: hypothetical protein ACPG70_07725 [Candidatus Puniceispirillaceae bacterium]
MKISGRSIYIALVAVPVLWADSQPAYALLCTRYSLDHSGFVDIAAAASWYPEYLNIPDRHFKEIEGQKSLRFIHVNRMKTGNDVAEIEMVYQLLPSRKLLASLRQLGRFEPPGDAAMTTTKHRNRFYRAFNSPLCLFCCIQRDKLIFIGK